MKHSALICLVRIARHHGVDLSIEKLLHEHSISEDEVDTSLLIRIGKANSFKIKSFATDWDGLLHLGEAYPAMARTKDGQYIILLAVRPKTGSEDREVLYVDPARDNMGLLVASPEEFLEFWSGELVLIKRRYAADDPNQPFSLRWFIPELLARKNLFRDVAISAMVLNVLALALPLFTQIIIDKVLLHQSQSTLQVLGLGMLGVLLFDTAFNFAKGYILLHASSKIDLSLARKTFGKLASLPIHFFEQNSSGILVKHMQQTEKIRSFLTGKLFMTLLEATILLVLIPILFLYSAWLTSVVLCFSLLIALILALLIRPFKRRLNRLYEAEGERQALLVETIHGMNTVKSLALEPQQGRQWEGISAKAAWTLMQVGKIGLSGQTSTGLLQKVMLLLIPWLGVQLVFDGQLTTGALIAFQMLASRVSGPLVQIVSLINEYQEIGLSVEMLGNIMNRPSERMSNVRGITPQVNGSVSLDNVTFRYNPGGPAALANVTLNIPAGMTLGVVGRSGSGKSTMTRLIQGLYLVQEGTVRVGGYDVREYDLPHLRRHIGVVLQDNFIFKGTVRQNISMPRPSASIEEVMLAARLAGADEFIQRLPQGYDTPLAENGANLSGGQRQRLAIARALIVDPRLLILDEATSALDAESEAIVQTNLKAIAKGRTTIIVSHRLSMLMDCHQVIVMNQGSIVAHGTHAQLLERSVLYRELWRLQNRHADGPEKSGDLQTASNRNPDHP